MRNRVAFMVMAVLMAVTVIPGAAAADSHDDPIYLSLGTSLSAGTLADVNGVSQPFTNKSFTDRLYPRLRNHFGGGLEHVKLGCPGETSTSMVTGTHAEGDPSICSPSGFDLYETGTQLGDALALLDSGANVQLITLDMGANDILRAVPSILACGDDAACVQAILGGIANNIAGIVGALRATGYDGPILAMNYYNPNLAAWVNPDVFTAGMSGVDWALLTTSLSVGFNDALDFVYGLFGVTVVDVESAFGTLDFGDDDGDGVPNNVETVCALTDMCPSKPGALPNIHLNPGGYLTVSRVFLAAYPG